MLNGLKWKVCILALSSLGAIAHLSAADTFTEKGSLWTGGSLQYGYVTYTQPLYDNTSYKVTLNTMTIQSFARIFPCKYLFMGPSVALAAQFNEDYTYTQFALGADVGFAYGQNEHIIPYCYGGGRWLQQSFKSPESKQARYQGWSVPVAAGVLVPLFNGVGLQLEPGYTHLEIGEISYNAFNVTVGICGVIGGKAISLSNIFSIL